MAYIPHYRATFKGDFRSAPTAEPFEQWNFSIALKSGGSLSTSSMQDKANDLADDLNGLRTAMVSSWASNTFVSEVRLDSVGADGKITRDPVFAQVGTNGVAGGGTPKLPPSCAVVITLDTRVRGRSRFGRFYLPLLGIQANADGVMPSTDQTNILNAAQTFVNNVSNAPGSDDGFGVVVASGVGEGSLNEVQAIRVGRVIDTMRSRRRSMDEAYMVATIQA